MDELHKKAKDSNVDYVLSGTLYLRGKTRYEFFNFIKEAFEYLYEPLSLLYKSGSADKEYKNKLYKMINKIRDKYNISNSYSDTMKEKLKQNESQQISFF